MDAYQDAANLLNVDRASVTNAKIVLRSGTPKEAEAVETGKAAVSITGAQNLNLFMKKFSETVRIFSPE